MDTNNNPSNQPVQNIPLNAVPENTTSKSNNSLLYIIIGVILLALIVGGIYFFSISKNSLATTQQEPTNISENPSSTENTNQELPSPQVTTNITLQQINDANYIFYYPSNYVKSNPISDTNLLNFTKPNSSYADSGEGIGLDKYPSQNRKAKPTFELCNTSANNMIKNGGIVISANAVDYANSHGCEIIISMKVDDKINDETISHFKQLWYKMGEDYSIYAATGAYFASMPKAESQLIDSAITQFMLK